MWSCLLQLYTNTAGSRRMTPPGHHIQKSNQEGELQYLDLDLTSTPEKRQPKLAPATEYKEIDFVKTNALCKAKQKMESEKERKNSDAALLHLPHQH